MLQLLPDIRVHEVRLSHRAILDACMQHIGTMCQVKVRDKDHNEET